MQIMLFKDLAINYYKFVTYNITFQEKFLQFNITILCFTVFLSKNEEKRIPLNQKKFFYPRYNFKIIQ